MELQRTARLPHERNAPLIVTVPARATNSELSANATHKKHEHGTIMRQSEQTELAAAQTPITRLARHAHRTRRSIACNNTRNHPAKESKIGLSVKQRAGSTREERGA